MSKWKNFIRIWIDKQKIKSALDSIKFIEKLIVDNDSVEKDKNKNVEKQQNETNNILNNISNNSKNEKALEQDSLLHKQMQIRDKEKESRINVINNSNNQQKVPKIVQTIHDYGSRIRHLETKVKELTDKTSDQAIN
uniref:Uncharacterized protein n=1 Tax=Meloidogyne hapla TaxID=6305 RepID=A0A1I8BB07_MELHA